MGAESLYRFPAHMESLVSMVEHLQSAAKGTDATTVLRAETALEELLSNSIVHGGASQFAQAWVWMSAVGRGDGVLLRYEDPFAPFDPMAKIDEALRRTSNPMEQRPVGGLGLLMVFRMADEFRYRREGDRNRIDLLFASRPAR